MGDLGDRMKAYEGRETELSAMPMLPLYARIDGRCFHTFTRHMDRPFDAMFSSAMIETTRFLVEQTHPLIGYTQSDEISLAWLQRRSDSELPFGGRLFKITSCLASLTTAKFLRIAQEAWPEICAREVPTFDCRVFSLPTPEELANMFLWRERDATKNAISMAARAYYGQSKLHRKTAAEMQDMLFARGINFNDYPAHFKRGTFVRRRTVLRDLTGAELERIPAEHRPSGPVERSEIVTIDMPSFGAVTNRVAVICEGAEPATAIEGTL